MSLEILMKAVYWFLLALTFALIEIEIEGKYGWAEKSQTWYRTANHHKDSVLLRLLMGKKPLTGYHIFIFFAAFLIPHSYFFMGGNWSFPSEIMTIAVWLAWAPLWDNLWFIFNPSYGLGNDQIKEVWWYKNTYWVGGLFPMENVTQWIASISLAGIASLVTGKLDYLISHVAFLAFLFILSVLSAIFLSPIYRTWNVQMRKHDDREKAGIYH